MGTKKLKIGADTNEHYVGAVHIKLTSCLIMEM